MLPTILINCFFYGIYFEIFGFGLNNFEFSRVNMQISVPSLLTAYVGRYGGDSSIFVPPLYDRYFKLTKLFSNIREKVAEISDLIAKTFKKEELPLVFDIIKAYYSRNRLLFPKRHFTKSLLIMLELIIWMKFLGR